MDTTIFIDFPKNTVTLLDAENGRLMRVINVDENAPIHITIDNDFNVYIIHQYAEVISVWSRDFTSNRILLSENDMAKRPPTIVYSEVNDSLYISYTLCNKIDSFRLK